MIYYSLQGTGKRRMPLEIVVQTRRKEPVQREGKMCTWKWIPQIVSDRVCGKYGVCADCFAFCFLVVIEFVI